MNLIDRIKNLFNRDNNETTDNRINNRDDNSVDNVDISLEGVRFDYGDMNIPIPKNLGKHSRLVDITEARLQLTFDVARKFYPNISRDNLEYIYELSIKPRGLKKPLSWLIVFQCAAKYGMNHTRFPSKAVTITDDDFIQYCVDNQLVTDLGELLAEAANI